MTARSLLVVALVCVPLPARALYGGAAVPKSQGGGAVFFEWRAGSWSGSCSGTLIAPSVVLTAAHCVRTEKGRVRRVRVVRIGNPSAGTARAKVKTVHVHPGYDPKRAHAGNDLALIILARPVTDHVPVRIAAAADDPTRQGERLTITGFGLSPRGRRLVLTRKLLGASLEYLPPHGCFSGPVDDMAKTRLCAASVSAGVCPGDSGAPALGERDGALVVIGVVSLAIDAGSCVETAAVLTRVSAFHDWITALIP